MEVRERPMSYEESSILAYLPGSGHAVDFDPHWTAEEAHTQWENLENDNWIDLATRAVFLEWSGINPNEDFLVSIRFIVEITRSGRFVNYFLIRTAHLNAFVPNYLSDYTFTQLLNLIMDFMWLLMTLYFMHNEITEMNRVWKRKEVYEAFSTLFLQKNTVTFEYSPFDFYVKDHLKLLKAKNIVKIFTIEEFCNLKKSYENLNCNEKQKYSKQSARSNLKQSMNINGKVLVGKAKGFIEVIILLRITN